MRFDAAFCSLARPRPQLGGAERAHAVPNRGFNLLSDGYDSELSADFEGRRPVRPAKPIQEAELDRVLKLT